VPRQTFSDEILLEMYGQLDCDICQERLDDDECAEMYDPYRSDHPTLTCHGQCGLDRGMELA
jgi:hypothetical protein